jgi:hypothetical protein
MDEKSLEKLIKEVIKEEFDLLRREVTTKEDLKAFATKEDFLEFERRLSSSLERLREGVRLSLIELEQELREVRSKLRFYDFDYLVKQNDAILKTLKDLYDEKTIITAKLKEHQSRIETIETKIS